MRGGVLLLLMTVMMFSACDDNTSTLGVDMMPPTDLMTQEYKAYDVATTSFEVGDHVLARTSMSYLGRFTDPETGTVVESDFLAQFNCAEHFAFPERVTDNKITGAEIKLYVDKFIGDSLTSFKLSVYPLNRVMDPDEDYYTDIDPTLYYDNTAAPVAQKWYTLADQTITDDERWDDDYYNHITISMPVSMGQAIYDAWIADKSQFANTSAWAESGIPGSKGFYFKLESGDGAMAYIDIAQFNLYFRFFDEEYQKDTTGVCQFAATEEVVQATRFENSNLDKLLADKSATYLKTPAGIFTEVTLPVEQINMTDTINSAKLTFTRYNDRVESAFKLDIPQNLLLVRKDDYLNGFFQNYNLADDKTSFLTTFNSSKNTYEFANISTLLTRCVQEKKDGTATANWNKVLLIPVDATYDASNQLVKLCHDFSMSSARLVGGEESASQPQLEVIYSRFMEE